MRLLIHGSCVSRDALKFAAPGDGIDLVDYYARTSLASLGGKRYTGPVDLAVLSSKFQRRMVSRDLLKSFLDDLSTLDFDVLLIDLIDERFHVHEGIDGASTVSSEFRRCVPRYARLPGRLLKSGSPEFMERWAQGWTLLVNILKRYGLIDRVWINAVFWSRQTDSGQGYANHDPTKIESTNRMLALMYKRIVRDIPQRRFIHYPEHLMVGSSHHQWGPSPYHYVRDYYRALIQNLVKIAGLIEASKGKRLDGNGAVPMMNE
jgi:hypothetical protein